MTYVRYRLFGKNSVPTIYYFTGYGTHIKNTQLHIYSLVLSGYRVVAFEYSTDVLRSGEPKTFIDALYEICQIIRNDKIKHEVAGVYAISMGTWFAENIMKEFKIERGVYNSSGCSVPGTIWNKPKLSFEKAIFQKNGYTRDDLEKAWRKYNVILKENNFTGKRLLVMNTSADEIVDIYEARDTMSKWCDYGNEVEFIEISTLKHSHSILRNMLRFRKVANFYANFGYKTR